MSDPATPPSDQDLAGQLAGSAVRHLGGYVAGLLLGVGAISSSQESQTAAIVASIAGYLLVQGWSFARKLLRARRAA